MNERKELVVVIVFGDDVDDEETRISSVFFLRTKKWRRPKKKKKKMLTMIVRAARAEKRVRIVTRDGGARGAAMTATSEHGTERLANESHRPNDDEMNEWTGDDDDDGSTNLRTGENVCEQ